MILYCYVGPPQWLMDSLCVMDGIQVEPGLGDWGWFLRTNSCSTLQVHEFVPNGTPAFIVDDPGICSKRN